MGHTAGQWRDRIRDRLGDHGVNEHIDPVEIESGLEAALHQFGADFPRQITQTEAGDGTTYEWTMTSYEDRLSRVVQVEYPTGSKDPTILERTLWLVPLGSTTLRLLEDVPAAGESVAITYTTPSWPFPDDTTTTDLVPDPWFSGVTALAASLATTAAATRAARQDSNAVVGQLFQTDVEALRAAARDLRAIYDAQVLGIQPDTGAGDTTRPPALAIADVEVFPRSLNHPRSH